MSAFEYQALDAQGRTRTGVISAQTERAARQELQERRLAPVKLAPARPAAQSRLGALGRLGQRLDARALALVTRQLATLIAVAPLEEALRTIALQADRPAVRRVLLATHGALLEGHRLSAAMARQGASFPPLYRAMVAAGEASGSLPSILERLADLLEQEQQARGKVLTAVVYPAALAITALVVIVALMTFVVPKVVDQFDSMGATLPLLTRVIIAISTGVRDFGWLALLGLAGGAFLLGRALRAPAFRLRFDGALLRLPVLGKLMRDLHAARLARTLSTMIAGGLPILEGLVITAPTVRNRVLRQATEEMAAVIREGGSLSTALRRAGVFPPLLIYMAASGETSGRVDLMLERAAEYLEREFNTFTSVALSLLEPAIIIVMGGVVALIVLSILLPILQINTLAFS
ncbi:MAG: type II secretion system inner membrane protein GspF [Phenylobacterium sp.]|uniref:type II secretion system inner membrane protein GspF n=1 Tax=Phenylobacterium sp. TaxID=1871053 RepID=UPI00391C3CB1